MNKFLKNLGSVTTLIASDVLTIIVAFFIAFLIRDLLSLFVTIPVLISDDPISYQLTTSWIVPLYLVIFWLEGLYTNRRPFWQETRAFVRTIALTALLIYTIVLLGQLNPYVSRIIFILHPFITMILIPITRRVTKIILFRIGLWVTPIIEIQVDTNYSLDEIWNANGYIGYEISKTYRLSLNSNKKIDDIEGEILHHMKVNGISTIAIVTKDINDAKLSQLVEKVYFIAPHIIIVPEYMTFDVINADVYHLMYENLFVFDIKKGLVSQYNQLIKRITDIVVAGVGIIITLPIMIVTALLIYAFDGGPVLHKQERYGKDGKIFTFMKFRSMYKNNEKLLSDYLKQNPDKAKEWDEYQKLKGYDPRIIKVIGNITRKFDLDELPQLFNVLIGSMSIIGPRPYLPRERHMIGTYFHRILSVKPGITGLWQATGRNNFTFKQRLNIDTWYIQNWSLWLDFVIAIKTLRKILL